MATDKPEKPERGTRLTAEQIHRNIQQPAELEIRRSDWQSNAQLPARGYERLFVEHVTQADEGIDFDFLAGCGGPVPPARRPF